jgi:hypothetical protein
LIFELFLDKARVFLVLLEKRKGKHGVFGLFLIGNGRSQDESLLLGEDICV